MALIKCPECGKEKVSDNAPFCPECGFGIREYYSKVEQDQIKKELEKKHEEERLATVTKAENHRKSRVENVKLPDKPDKNKYIFAGVMCGIMALIGWLGVITGIGFIWLIIAVLFSVLAAASPKVYRNEVDRYEYAIKNPEEYKNAVIDEEDRKKEEAISQAKRDALKANSAPTCPRCGSIYISTVNRGYSIVSGFIGSGKAMNVCQKCGHKWSPHN